MSSAITKKNNGKNHDKNRCDSGQQLLDIDKALELLLKNATPITETEILPLLKAKGRVLAEDILSTINVPPADNSAMDGYALHGCDVSDDEEITLPISQRIPAGSVGNTLKSGTAARIFTGAPIPVGANTVVMQELCTLENNTIKITGPIPIGKNIRRAGEDILAGHTILKQGSKLRPQDLGLAASVGISHVTVYKRLRVGIFFTGDELREPHETLEEGQIYNSNRYTLHSLLDNLNCDVIDLGNVKDTLQATKDAMLLAAQQTDLVMTSGGVSVGEEDYIRIALEEVGTLEMWRINIKPGKPFAFGKIANIPFLGMPGNPVSVFATFCIFSRPFILCSQGIKILPVSSFKVPADFEWNKPDSRNEFLRAKIDDGKLTLYPHQGSGVLTSTSWANGLAFIPKNTVIKKGDLLDFLPFGMLDIT